MFRYAGDDTAYSPNDTLQLSRVSCIIMLVAYVAYLVFQLWTHREFFEAQEVLFSSLVVHVSFESSWYLGI